MNATLFSEIQRLFERTYVQVGINLEDCLIDRQRCGQLSRAAGASARELIELARTFLRKSNDCLHIGIYYSRWLIEQLEKHDPRKGITDETIRCLIAFVEEINHALHAAIQFQRGAPDVGYYEDLGRSNFRMAAGHQVARTCELNEVFEKLADGFRDIRLALNRLSDSLIHLDNAAAPLFS